MFLGAPCLLSTCTTQDCSDFMILHASKQRFRGNLNVSDAGQSNDSAQPRDGLRVAQWPWYLLDGDEDDVAGHDLDDVDLQEPPDEQLQLVKILQELEKEDGQAVDHQVPLVLQV